MARRSPARLRLALLACAALAVVGVLLSSPRHRQLYSRLVAPPSAPVPDAPPPLPDRTPGQTPPPSPGTADGLSTKSAPATATPRAGAADRVVVKVADTVPPTLPSPDLPSGWTLKEFVGPARVEVVREDSSLAFRLVSEGSSFALSRDVVLDVKLFPILRWRWKVVKLPTGGDARERARDDQAAQVYLVFPRWPSPRTNSDVIGYVWDTHAPPGAKLTSPQSANVKVVVLQSGGERMGQWVEEERNIYRDYVELFNREPPRVGKVALMVDSNDTQSQAEAFVEDLLFLRAPTRPAGQR